MVSKADREESLVVTCSWKGYAIYYQAGEQEIEEIYSPAGGFSAAPLLAPFSRKRRSPHIPDHTFNPIRLIPGRQLESCHRKTQSGCPPWFNWVQKTRRCFAKWCATTRTNSTRRVRCERPVIAVFEADHQVYVKQVSRPQTRFFARTPIMAIRKQ
jgi:hypothetical protein